MSIERMAWALNLEDDQLTPTDKLILIGIANHDGDGGAWPSMGTLARYAGCTRRTARKSVRQLEERGHIEVHVQEGGTHQTPKAERPNLYTFPGGVRGDRGSGEGGSVGTGGGRSVGTPEPSSEPSSEPSAPAGMSDDALDAAFERFWEKWPARREKKALTKKHFCAAVETYGLEFLRASFRAWRGDWEREDFQYTPAPHRWFSSEKFLNPPSSGHRPERKGGGGEFHRRVPWDQLPEEHREYIEQHQGGREAYERG